MKAAVLGLNCARSEETKILAAKIQVPILFIWQLEDETLINSPESVLSLVRAFGTRDKRLHANPGTHVQVPPDEFEAIERFLSKRLTESIDSKDESDESTPRMGQN